MRTCGRLALILALTASPVIGDTIHAPADVGDCEPQWQEGFESIATGTNGTIYAFETFDDGTGSALFVGGNFTKAGGIDANFVAKWDGVSWSSLGIGTNGTVYAFATFDADGPGPNRPALYVGGSFTGAGGQESKYLARWNGVSWSTVPGAVFSGTVNALAVNGGLYAGGLFQSPAPRIARWNGQLTWSDLGTGDTDGVVYTLKAFNDATGSGVLVGGDFYRMRGVTANSVARWNGTSWAAVGGGISGDSVKALTFFNDGSGDALFAAGRFYTAGGASAENMAKWNGNSWSPVGAGLPGGFVIALASFSGGPLSRPELYAGGYFAVAGSPYSQHIAKWDGVSWSAIGSGTNDSVAALAVFDDGTGPSIYVGGGFLTAGGGAASKIAKTNGTVLAGVHVGKGADGHIESLNVLDVGNGRRVYALGDFLSAGNAISRGVAEWDGHEWRSLGGGATNGQVRSLAAFDDGTGPALYAAGSFTNIGGVDANYIAKWNGTRWSSLGSGTNVPISSLAVYDDGNGARLYAACDFFVAGGVPVNRIARWDGQSWTPLGLLGGGLAGGTVDAMVVFDPGTGPVLVVGGAFTSVNDEPIAYLAQWSADSWAALGAGVDGRVTSLDVLDDGSGPALFVRGMFSSADGLDANMIAKWDGSAWNTLLGGVRYYGEGVEDLEVFDDGTGRAIYATGGFTWIGGTTANRIAKWDGVRWWSLGNVGLNHAGRSLAVHDDGTGPALYVAGEFTEAGGLAARRVARWDGGGWSVLDIGINAGASLTGDASVNALAVLNESLYLGGSFETAGPSPSRNFARWEGCASQFAAADFDTDGDIHDFRLFEGCLAGPSAPYDPQDLPIEWPLPPGLDGIIAADMNHDRHVDLRDFGVFQNQLFGP